MINVNRDSVSNVASTDFPGNFPGEDLAWDLEKFKKSFNIDIAYMTDETANFDLVGIDTSVANAFRRIMIAEVPSVAIETVFVEQNTSVIQDEVLSQRLGLVPIKINPDSLTWVPKNADGSTANDTANTVMFELHVKCERKGENGPIVNDSVYARDLKFKPTEGQVFDTEPTVGNPDILLAKLAPGQEILLTCWAVLGIGSDHAKFSPVATASYRLMPVIDITGDIQGADAEKFKNCFPPGVVELRDGRPVVVNPRKDTVSREVLRHPEFEHKVKLGRRRDHFIFNVESTGAMTPAEIFLKSIDCLRRKAQTLQKAKLES